MSKAMQGALAILIVLLIVCAGVAVFALIQKQSTEQQNQSLQAQISDEQNKEAQLLAQAKKLQKDQQDLNTQLTQKDKEKQQLQQTYDDIKSKYDEITNQVSQLTQERDDWKGRVGTIRHERDQLIQKLKHPQVKIVYRDRPVAQAAKSAESPVGIMEAPPVTSPKGDQYWANILKQKAALQLDLEKAKADLDQSAVQIVELKKQNADLQLEFKNLNNTKQDLENKIQQNQQEFERKLKYSEDLANSISIEVARAHNDQKTANDRLDKMRQENTDMQAQIRQLSTTKVALEKTIAGINAEKVIVQKKLAETEGTIQGRINEIWQIKQNLDKKISDLPKGGEVELPPIIVNANGQTGAAQGVKTEGTIVSINEPNNFAIVDLGEGDGSQIGRKLTVLRNNNPIGSMEIIQVRKDISAADIKQSSNKFKVGDIVRY
jgi:DNA repair exonuclease SbcCD ATPase subunit